jgi:anti-anti-sigma factor
MPNRQWPGLNPRFTFRGVEPVFDVRVEPVGPSVLITVSGEIDMATCGQVRDAIEPYLSQRGQVVLDLAAVTFMDSSGIGVLARAHECLGGSLTLRDPSPFVRRILGLTGVAFWLNDDQES